MKRWMDGDLMLALFVTAIVAAMIVPLPSWVLDLGLAANLAGAVILLGAVVFARDALNVATFPTLLLLTTLFRLALNVSSTRLALAEGHAGRVIEAFGTLVIRGNYVVGGIVFAILTLVQFLVVAKGAERVAEVSARFSLDAMPGKQMAIDADLRSGNLDAAQAKERRRELERHSQLFGAMDGAMKFVKGDVIAGLLIVLVNGIGGTATGVFQAGLALADASSQALLIAIGDGLASQLPSLLITLAAGLVVTRVAGKEEGGSLGEDMGAQLFAQYRPVAIAAGFSWCLAVVPGMPAVVFAPLGLLLSALAFTLYRRDCRPPPAAPRPAPAQVSQPPAFAPIAIHLSQELQPLVDESSDFVRTQLDKFRERVYVELGLKLPGIHVRVGTSLKAHGYVLLLEEVPAASGEARCDRVYLMEPPALLSAQRMVDPVTGKAISALPAGERVEGHQIFSAGEFLLRHLEHVVRRHAGLLLGVQDVQCLLDELEPSAPTLVREVLAKVPLPLLTEVLRRLLAEHLSIRHLRGILETLASPHAQGDAGTLADACRMGLARQLSHRYAPSGPLFAYLVDPAVEEALRPHLGELDPDKVGDILQALEGIVREGTGAVLLTSPDVRRRLKKLCEPRFPELAVLTFGELTPDVQIRPVGKLSPIRPWS